MEEISNEEFKILNTRIAICYALLKNNLEYSRKLLGRLSRICRNAYVICFEDPSDRHIKKAIQRKLNWADVIICKPEVIDEVLRKWQISMYFSEPNADIEKIYDAVVIENKAKLKGIEERKSIIEAEILSGVRGSLPSEQRPWEKFSAPTVLTPVLPKMSMYSYLYHSNKNFPHNNALRYFGKQITYGEMFENIDACASALLRVGVLAGDTVALAAPNIPESINAPDKPPELSKEAVIWCVNHGFKDDVAASIHATRHSYVYFGSLPHFYNTFDGLALFLNGVILCNRKIRRLKQASYDLAVRSLRKGNDLAILPEGVWNKTPEKLVLDLWPGVYRMAKETGSKVVPVIHYLADPHKKYEGNVIHTVVADPISMEGLSEKEGLELLRDIMATWYFLLMEKYGQSTRQELLDGFETADDAWESYIAMHTGCVKYYDREIELCADYRPKQIARPEDVWQSVANIRNIHAGNAIHVKYARELVAREKRRDFQRRF